jgi:formate dehydrogenase iron-sulfur subunit
VFPKNTLPADFYNVRPASNHFPLVVLLVLTQLSVGAFSVNYVVSSFYSASTVERFHALVALGLGLVALGASTWHLGRPVYGFRAVMGLRHSWMSREIACFGAFAGLAVAYAAGAWADPLLTLLGLPPLPPGWSIRLQRSLGGAVAVAGLLGVACSAMLYAVTRREFWRLAYSGPRFLGTCALLGVSLTLLVWSAAARFGAPVPGRTLDGLCRALLAANIFKLLLDASVFTHLKSARVSDLKRTALLMWGELAPLTRTRFALGIVAGLALPGLLLLHVDATADRFSMSSGALAMVVLSCLGLVAAELCERSLFFMAAASPKMPGSVGK